jgi:hypothetical protein
MAFGANVALTSQAQPLAVIPDGWASQDSAGFANLPIPMKIKALWAGGVGMDKCRLIVPSLKVVSFPRVARFDVVAQPPANPNYENLNDYPFPVGAIESWEFQSDNTNAGAQNHFVVVHLEDVHAPAPPGPSWTLLGTGSAVAALRTWANSPIVWEDAYPSKLYGVIGIRVTGANVVAARLIPQGSGPRPGCFGQAAESTVDRSVTWDGRYGILTTFRPPVFPFIEVLGSGATATQRVYLQCVVLGP